MSTRSALSLWVPWVHLCSGAWAFWSYLLACWSKEAEMGAHRVLIIDDDPAFVKATQAILEAHGYEVFSASGGEAGLAKAVELTPDLVLLDVMMDWVLDGVSVSRSMMEEPTLRKVPIIMVTSIRGSEYRDAFPQDEYLHINSWLDKPCSPEDLLSEVKSVLSRHEALSASS
jgi:DNA-binding response OmpR family regulator